ncbi:hypothetical protein VCUG_01249 [Vavraia culicis subsp. floridensis]|uniref:Uncharacterized protein n=1 Tax=Vavraia culicis (isolate floridensis) TaxID=948595 RepID=L2GVD3_VAVCU|nr:uncharacterized protein VCUG_01249 [Vavraia culicis subsp. floridensis]ELA47253.1 hypothetical protein VCUG_01249 [Vavraia culicis subsp. floridensis]
MFFVHILAAFADSFYIQNVSTKKFMAKSKTNKEPELVDDIKEASEFNLKASGKINEEYIQADDMTLTVEMEKLKTEQNAGLTIYLDKEKKTEDQLFMVVQRPKGEVRFMIKDMCISVDINSEKIIAIQCSDDDINNLFKLLTTHSEIKQMPPINRAKLEALKEVARVSPKLREKIGMDYLDSLG